MSTLMDVRLILEQDALARNQRSRPDRGQSVSDSLLCLKCRISVIPSSGLWQGQVTKIPVFKALVMLIASAAMDDCRVR
jgi:hypothetical protein